MPTRRAAAPPRPKSPRPLTAARVMRVWCDLLDYRARLKAEALATGKDAPGRTTKAARRALVEFDTEVASIASRLRGWRTLKGIERTSRMAAPSRVRTSTDLAADFVATEKLAEHAWYTSVVGPGVESLVERLFAPWTDIARARSVLVARKKKRTPNAARDLDALDASLTHFVEDARIWKQLASMHTRFARVHELHGQQLAVQLLLEDMRAMEQAIPELLRGRNTLAAPKGFPDAIRDAAERYGKHSRAFWRAVRRAVFSAKAGEVARLARALRRDEVVVADALMNDVVQTALATDVSLAAQHVLSILRIVKPRTMQRLLATSRVNVTTR